MKIFRGNIELVDIELDDNSVFKHVIMGDETCTLNFTISQYYDFTIGDYILYEGQKFTMNVASSVVKNYSNSYTYSIIFEGIKYDLSKVLCTNSGKYGSEVDFFSYTNMEGILDLIILNANGIPDWVWQKGVCSVTPYFNFQITNENCLQVLNKACLEFNVEFECLTTETGNVINVRDSIGINEGTTLEYKKGILSLKREPSSQDNILTRLYPRGSDKNIPESYYSKRIMIDRIIGENVSMGIYEQAVNFDDIFPHFEGELTRVSDTSFSCAEIDFNLNDYLIPGVTARVAFLSGDLAGYIFDIDSYDNGTKTVTINTLIDDIERTLPNDDYVITTGDKFTFVDIYMPTAYLTAAEAELLERATEYLEKYNYPFL